MRELDLAEVLDIKKYKNMSDKIITYKCKHCGQEINADTISRLIFCGCGKLGVDGNEYYVRVLGEEVDFEVINR